MISQFFILSPRGDVIIRRDYLGNVPKVFAGAVGWGQEEVACAGARTVVVSAPAAAAVTMCARR